MARIVSFATMLVAIVAGLSALEAARSSGFSADAASRIVFSRYVSDQEPEPIFTVGSDGSRLRRLVEEGNHPAWSPDGRRIAFDTPSGIFVINGDGGGGHQLNTGLDVYGNARWSPDGTRIVYDRVRSHGLATVRTAGKHRALRLPVGARQADWSPDGHHLAFQGLRRNGTWGPIYVANLDGSALRQITQPVDPEEDVNVRWSPDGRRLLFIREGVVGDHGYEDQIYSVGQSGGGTQLYVTQPSVTSVSWAPNGKQIAYAGGPSTCCQIHIFDLATRADRFLKLKPCRRPASCQQLDWR